MIRIDIMSVCVYIKYLKRNLMFLKVSQHKLAAHTNSAHEMLNPLIL